MANRSLQLREPRNRVRFIKEDLHKRGIKPLLHRNYGRLFRRHCCTCASSTSSKQACQASLRTIRAWVGVEKNLFPVAKQTQPAIVNAERGAAPPQVAAIWRGSGCVGNPKDKK